MNAIAIQEANLSQVSAFVQRKQYGAGTIIVAEHGEPTSVAWTLRKFATPAQFDSFDNLVATCTSDIELLTAITVGETTIR